MNPLHLKKLHHWYKKNKRSLPWREHPTIYRVWVSEIMLQQTQVQTVLPYFEKFIRRFPSVESLATSLLEDVLKHWSGLGYYRRARHLFEAANVIYGAGGFPTSLEGWMKLPGIGRYTAGAILSIALNQPTPILDGNVKRVLSRVFRLVDEEDLWKKSELTVEASFAEGISPRDFNQALMELGATVCTPEGPSCASCPWFQTCAARKSSEVSKYPLLKKSKSWEKIQEEVACIVNDRNEVLLHLNPESRWRKGLWDFPSLLEAQGQFEALGEERGRVRTKLIVTHHKIDRTTRVYSVAFPKAESQVVSSGWRWVNPMKISDLPRGASLTKSLRATEKLREDVQRSTALGRHE